MNKINKLYGYLKSKLNTGANTENKDETSLDRQFSVFYISSISFILTIAMFAFMDYKAIIIGEVEKEVSVVFEDHASAKTKRFLKFYTEKEGIFFTIEIPWKMKLDVDIKKGGMYCANYLKKYYDTNRVEYMLINVKRGKCMQETPF